MASFLYSTTAKSDINTKNDNSWKTISDIIPNTINSIPNVNDAASITAVEVSFVIHSDWNGYFSTDTRLVINGASTTAQHYNTGKFSGNKRRTYKFLINDNDFTIGYLKNNKTQLNLQFKAYRASGQGTLKVYCKSQTVKITYYTGVIPISFESPANEEQFKQYTDEINIRLSKKSNDTNTYTLKIKNTETSKEIYSEGMVFNNDIYNKSIGPYNTLQTLTLECLNSNNASVAKCQIEIIKNDIFSISSVINRYDKNNNEYESAFDGTWVKLDINITTLAESFLNKPMVFTLAAGNEEEKIYVKKENLVKNFKIINKDYFELSSDSNHTVVLSAKEAQTDSDGNPIFPEDSTISEEEEEGEEEERIPKETDLEIFRQEIPIFPATPIFNVYEGGVAIGKFSTGTPENPKFECAYPAVFQYSEGPVEAGIWINGETIYRKIITFEPPEGQQYAINADDIGIFESGIKYKNIKDIIKFYGGCKRGSGAWGPLDYSAVNTTSNVSLYIMPKDSSENPDAEIRVGVGTGSTVVRGILILEYTLIDENE